MSHQLPELPEPSIEGGIYNQTHKIMVRGPVHFTADQMRAYAELAIASVKREPLSDGYILDLIDDHRQRHNGEKLIKFARAIEQAHGIGVLDDKVQPIKYPSSTASQWLPIDSAPKDDLFVAKGNKFNDPAKGQFYVIAKREDDSFIDDADDCPSPFLTHWMPLPPPPVTATTASREME